MAVMLPTSKARGRKRMVQRGGIGGREFDQVGEDPPIDDLDDRSSPDFSDSSPLYAGSECSEWHAAQVAPSAARAAPMSPQVAFNTAEGRPAAYFVQGAATRVAKAARGPEPPSTPPPRRSTSTQTQPAPWARWHEPRRSTIGTQTDVFTDPMQEEEFLAAVRRDVVNRVDAQINAGVNARVVSAWRQAMAAGRLSERHAMAASGRPSGRPFVSAGRPAESAGPVSVAQGAKLEVKEGARGQ